MQAKRGPEVRIVFLDHAMCNPAPGKPVTATVWGLLHEETDTFYRVASWMSDNDPNDHNAEGFLILKSTVIEIVEARTWSKLRKFWHRILQPTLTK